MDLLHGKGGFREPLGVGAEDHLGQGGEEDGDADGRDERRQSRRFPQGAIGDPLDHHPQHHAGDHGDEHGQKEVHLELGHHQEPHKRPGHEDLAMGEVDQGDDPVDHGVAQGDECVGGAKGDAVDELL